jgi:regulator of cell morphogenesis and NO signaling
VTQIDKEQVMQSISPQEKVGALAARFPESIRVFTKRDIDFCCGGDRTLEQVCKEKDISPDVITEEIRASQSETKETAHWTEQPLGDLIDFILKRFHQPLLDDFSHIQALAEKALEAHRDKDEATLSRLARVVEDLKNEITSHLQKEEQVLFPWIRSGNGGTAGDPIRIMHMEHEEAALKLRRVRELTDNFTPPEYACATVEALWKSLEKLDSDLREHIHLENNILFPRALRE